MKFLQNLQQEKNLIELHFKAKEAECQNLLSQLQESRQDSIKNKENLLISKKINKINRKSRIWKVKS